MIGVYDTYPDHDSLKEVILHALGLTYSGMGDRHVVLQWINAETDEGLVTQMVQLTGQPGNYTYYAPVVRLCSLTTMQTNQVFSLGEFSRAQRDKFLDLARQVVFSKTSTTNGCRVWTRDLLVVMVKNSLVSQAKFNEVDAGVPLVRRVADA
jgi:hypothetical protein